MGFRDSLRGALLASFACTAMLSPAGALHAATFLEFVDPNPAPGNQFGHTVVALSTGNVVVTSPFDDAGGTDAGAVYLFNGSTGALISTLRGSTAHDNVGFDGAKALSNGNYVVRSTLWDNGGAADAGAVTWGSGTNGVSGVVSAANSLVGTTASDNVGSTDVAELTNGNYVVCSESWDNAGAADAGAVTWGSGASGVSGSISAANSLVGSTTGDNVGFVGVTVLSNGNYVVASDHWDNGSAVDEGAVTWGSGASGVRGVVSAVNSLVGSAANDHVGSVTALSNGNYVVSSVVWNNGGVAKVGAVTWCSGTTGVIGVVSAANSLVGSTANDFVGVVTALSNGNYVVSSVVWNNGGVAKVGAVTWCSGTTGVIGVVSAANSLVGSSADDRVGESVTALSNGNYVVSSTNWDNGGIANAGAATWCSGTSGVSELVSAANSLVGSTANDFVGRVTALPNGNYVVRSSSWNNGTAVDAGAVTWGRGTNGVSGAVSAANSLVGSSTDDRVGNYVMALTNGNYVVSSPNWNDGAVERVGAATWGSGTSGVIGLVSAANSLIGATHDDQVSFGPVTALSNGNYVVKSILYNGAIGGVGAATWGSGSSGVSGVVSAENSLVGSSFLDRVGVGGVTALTNGSYIVRSPSCDISGVANAGAVTWGSGTTGVRGVVSAANSLVGPTADDRVGGSGGVALPDGNYVVASATWDNVGTSNAGAATWGSGTGGVIGAVTSNSSLVGTTAGTNLLPIVPDNVNGTFIASFPLEGGGRVRVGPIVRHTIVSAADIPNDQGGWLRLTFTRMDLDVAIGSPAIATYGIWQHVPPELSSGAEAGSSSAALGAPPDAATVKRLRAALPSGLDVRETHGGLCVTASAPRTAEPTAVFPPGTWMLVTSVPAQQQAQYVADIQTGSNAAPYDYVVTAHTTTPSIWFASDAASGQSVDNLAPATPTQLVGAYAGGQTNLQWAANTENDLGSYRVYRGASADFTPSAGNLVATVTSNSHGDVGPLGGFYKVSAVDVNGNESGFALLTPGGTTDVDDDGPIVFALAGARPNPTSGRGLNVAFALPDGAAARLELLDVSGRQVLAREVGSLGAGRHTVNLSEGRGVAPGLYWLRLVQGPNRRTTRVTVIE